MHYIIKCYCRIPFLIIVHQVLKRSYQYRTGYFWREVGFCSYNKCMLENVVAGFSSMNVYLTVDICLDVCFTIGSHHAFLTCFSSLILDVFSQKGQCTEPENASECCTLTWHLVFLLHESTYPRHDIIKTLFH